MYKKKKKTCNQSFKCSAHWDWYRSGLWISAREQLQSAAETADSYLCF